MRITDEQIALFKKQGFLIIENFIGEDERLAALDGFYEYYAPPFDKYIAEGRKNETPQQKVFPWTNSGLNRIVMHPDMIDAAKRIIGTREICLSEAHLGMKYAAEESPVMFHIDYGNNTFGPIQEPDQFKNIHFFYCFEDVRPGMAPIMMVPNGHPDEDVVQMIVPGGSICIYTIFTRHSASPWLVDTGHRPTAWVGFVPKNRQWDFARGFSIKNGSTKDAVKFFINEASPRELELIGFPPPGDELWTESFLQGMVTRYPGFNPDRYR